MTLAPAPAEPYAAEVEYDEDDTAGDEHADDVPDDDEGDFEAEADQSWPDPVQPDDSAPSASFTVSNPLQGVPPATLIGLAVVAVGALVFRWLKKRKASKRESGDCAWVWREPAQPDSGSASTSKQPGDPSRPLLGSSLAITETCASAHAIAHTIMLCAPACGAWPYVQFHPSPRLR